MGVKCLTLYSFSTENWSRPKSEISALFALMRKYIDDDLQTLHKRGVRLRILGSRTGLKPDMLAMLDRVEATTKGNTAFFLNIAFNYGGRDEILRAARAFAGLGGHDIVFGPAEDGGFWLVGLQTGRAVPPGLFRDVRWSGPDTLTDAIASAGGARIGLVDRLRDVDRGADLAVRSNPRHSNCG